MTRRDRLPRYPTQREIDNAAIRAGCLFLATCVLAGVALALLLVRLLWP